MHSSLINWYTTRIRKIRIFGFEFGLSYLYILYFCDVCFSFFQKHSYELAKIWQLSTCHMRVKLSKSKKLIWYPDFLSSLEFKNESSIRSCQKWCAKICHWVAYLLYIGVFQNSIAQMHKCKNAQIFLVYLISANFEDLFCT